MSDMKQLLAEICSRSGIRQKQLAQLLSVSPVTLSKWMHGYAVPSDERIHDIKAIAALTPKEIHKRLADLNRPHKKYRYLIHHNGKTYCLNKRCIWRTLEGVCFGPGCIVQNEEERHDRQRISKSVPSSKM